MKADKNALVLHKGQPAIIVSRDADKFEIQLESGTKRVREKDFVILSPGPVVRIADVLDKTPPPADFTEAAEFFRDEPATFTDISELVWGPLSPEFAWACWREISSSPWFLCTTPNEPVTVRSAEEAAELVCGRTKVRRGNCPERLPCASKTPRQANLAESYVR